MKMKKFYSIIGLIVLIGCGTRHRSPVDPYPTIDRLLADGWKEYKKGSYEKAKAKFDSVIDINANKVEAHIGAGWSKAHLGEFKAAHTHFSLAISIGGKTRPVRNVWKECSKVYGPWVLKPLSTPIVGVPELKLVSKLREKSYTVLTPKEIIYYIKTFNDSMIILDSLNWSIENPQGEFEVKYVVDGDTVVDTLDPPFPPDTTDLLQVNYVYYKGGETDIQVEAYCGDGAVYCAEATMSLKTSDYLASITQSNGVLKMDSNYQSKYDDWITARRVRITLAQCYYNLKMFDKAIEEVCKVDTSWTPPSYDSDTFYYELWKKIKELLEKEGK